MSTWNDREAEYIAKLRDHHSLELARDRLSQIPGERILGWMNEVGLLNALAITSQSLISSTHSGDYTGISMWSTFMMQLLAEEAFRQDETTAAPDMEILI